MYIIGTYTVNEVERTMTVNESEYGMVFVYDVSLTDNTLTLQLSGGKPRKFLKQ
ncbi:MAG: hypothetical protein K6E92_02920 [Lachnospiraceae bacterium]|nr:hypothetical protein [Lachnospiraceae bacterium]